MRSWPAPLDRSRLHRPSRPRRTWKLKLSSIAVLRRVSSCGPPGSFGFGGVRFAFRGFAGGATLAEAVAKRIHEINDIVLALLGRRRFLDRMALGLAPDQLLERILVFVFELA